MTDILLPDIPAFCKTHDDVVLLFARGSYGSKEDALEDGRLNIKHRMIMEVIDSQKLASVPAKQLSRAKQWDLFFQYLFQIGFLSDTFTDVKNHRLATYLLDIKVDEYIGTAPGIRRGFEQSTRPRRLKEREHVVKEVSKLAGRNHRKPTRHRRAVPESQPYCKIDPPTPAADAEIFLFQQKILRIKTRSL